MNILEDIGELIVFEVYEFYDEPVLFAASNERGQIFLGLLAQDDAEIKRWLYAPLSSTRLLGLKSDWIDIYSAFKNVEGGRVFESKSPKNGEPPMGAWINASDLSDADLPDAGVFLDLGDQSE